MLSDFRARLHLSIQGSKGSNLALWLAPRLSQLPLPIQRYDDPFLPFGKAVINATSELVAAYVFDLAAYLALGAAGAVALERTIAYVAGRAVTILHGPFVGDQYLPISDETAFNVDAVTLASPADFAAYTLRPERGAFVVQPIFAIEEIAFVRGLYKPDNQIFVWDDVELRSVDAAVYQDLHGDDFEERVRFRLAQMLL